MNVETLLEPEPPPDGVRAPCSESSTCSETVAAPGSRACAAQARRSCLRDSLPPGARTNVDEVHVHRAVLRLVDLGDADRPVRVHREEDAAGGDLAASVLPLLLPRLRLEAGRLRHLALELLPELAQRGLVRLGRAADAYGFVSHPVSR